jgi:hypothetical protein
MHRESQAADLGYVVGCTGREARSGGRMGQKETAATATGKNRIMIFGPKTDGTYIIEFKTAAGDLVVGKGRFHQTRPAVAGDSWVRRLRGVRKMALAIIGRVRGARRMLKDR